MRSPAASEFQKSLTGQDYNELIYAEERPASGRRHAALDRQKTEYDQF